MRSVGARDCATKSPWRVRRASLCFAATLASDAVMAAVSGPEPRTSTSRPESVAVTWISSGFLVGPNTSAMAQAAGSAPSRILGQDRAAVDGDEVMRARGGKADFEHLMGAAARVKDDAAAAFAMGVDEIADRRVDAGLAQRRHDEIALPDAVRSARPVLQGAAAADAEMRADRRNALRARRLDG